MPAVTSPRGPYVVGLTGGIGSGKSAAAEHFAALGAGIIDTDLIAHQLTARGGLALPALEAAFGPQVIAADRALDRAAMRTRVFADPAARLRLEAILHPLIRAECEARVAALGTASYAMLVVPLLVESGAYRRRCRRVCVVDCPEALQVERVSRRSGLPEAEVRAIMAAQASRQDRLAAADDVIDNSGDLASLHRQVEVMHQRYVALAASAGAV
jgi:dephospho-CoA kinase